MIRNIVFDMGNVLVHYDPTVLCQLHVETKEDAEILFNCVYHSKEWLMLDMGIITPEAAVSVIQKRLGKPHLNLAIDHSITDFICGSEWKIEGMEGILASLKAKGYGLYILSNASLTVRKNRHLIPGFDYFDGTFFSCDPMYMKPQTKIYELFLEEFNLKAEECFFIDDLTSNITGAKKAGMHGAVHETKNAENLKIILQSENII